MSHFITTPDTLATAERLLFDILATDPDRVWTKAEIMIAAPRRFPTTRALDSTAARLGARLAEFDGRRSPCNVWGVGYRLS